jgi:hypothetical protein
MPKSSGIRIRGSFLPIFLLCIVLLSPTNLMAQTGYGNPSILAKMQEINRQLLAHNLNLAVEALECLTMGGNRPSARIHQQGSRWVPNDIRRNAQATDITYWVDQVLGDKINGLSNDETKAAIDRAMATWGNNKGLKKTDIIERNCSDPNCDPTVFDDYLDGKTVLPPYVADIVHAGWWPKGFFERAIGPGGGDSILAFSVTFVFLDSAGNYTDLNGDHYLDTAFTEIYYNKNFYWGIDVDLSQGIDVETVALHESGHALGLGHFGPPPTAVMNAVYSGRRQTPLPIDGAGLFTLWGSWPNR